MGSSNTMTMMMEFSRVLVPHAGKVQTQVQFLLLCFLGAYLELVAPTERSVMLKFHLYYILELKTFYCEVHFWSETQRMLDHQQILNLISKYLLTLLNTGVISFCALLELKLQSLVSGIFLWMMTVVQLSHLERIHT